MQLRLRLDQYAARIARAFPVGQVKLSLFSSLRVAGTTGLTGRSPDPEEGLQLVTALEQAIVRAAVDVRSRFILEMTTRAFIGASLGVLIAVAWLIAIKHLPSLYTVFPLERSSAIKLVNLLGAIGFGLLGTSLGAVFISFLKNRNLSFDNFDQIRQYQFPPAFFVAHVFAICLVLILLATAGLKLGMGELLITDILQHPYYAVFLGLISAISEPLATSLIEREVVPTVSQQRSDT